jgi:hypothetical protein
LVTGSPSRGAGIKRRNLANVTIPNSVAGVGEDAFISCVSLTSVAIPNRLNSIPSDAFEYCISLTGVYFQGNAPSLGSDVFCGGGDATGYILPGTTGWYQPFGWLSIALYRRPSRLGDCVKSLYPTFRHLHFDG